MRRKERDRLKVVAALAEGRLRQVEAARRLRLSVRQVRRILGRYRAEGDAGLVHRTRGRASNRRIGDPVRRRAVALVTRQYAAFGLTPASEKLAQRDGVSVGRERPDVPPPITPGASRSSGDFHLARKRTFPLCVDRG